MITSIFARMKTNWKSGVAVSLVSIPLSVSLAVASQATPMMGIITAILAGLVASIFGGSNYNIVGPTGALSGILATYAILHGAEALPMLAIIAGVIILFACIARLERYLVFIPASSINGFTLGVAFIIGLNQLNFALGLSGLEKHEKFISNVFESFSHIQETSLAAVALFSVFLVGLFAFLKFVPKVPGVIALTPIGILFGYLSAAGRIPLNLETLGMRFPDMSGIAFQLPDFSLDMAIAIPALAVALIAILETMISAKIADGMTKTHHNKRKEMLGLGLANIASGAAGGIPGTAALARTALNVKTGANDKMAATISSVMILIISFIFLRYFQYIPLAVIAAILVFVAARMIEVRHFRRMFELDKKSFGVAMLVAGVTIYEDPIIGILFGVAIALVLFMEKISHGQFELIINDLNKKIVNSVSGEDIKKINEESDTLVYSIKGQLAYINAQAHLSRFENALNGYQKVVLRLRELYFIDLDGVDAFGELVELIKSQGKQVFVTGASPLIARMLEESHVFQMLKKEGHVFERTAQALKSLGYEVNDSSKPRLVAAH